MGQERRQAADALRSKIAVHQLHQEAGCSKEKTPEAERLKPILQHPE